MVKRMMMVLVLAFLLVAVSTFLSGPVQADVEWKVLKNVELKTAPLDVAPSADGQRLFILTRGEILIYSLPEGRIIDQMHVDKEFDRIASLPRPDTLTISSSTKKTLQVIMFESIYKIDVSGLPFKGPQNAIVTIAIFDDYQ
jgi:hypothetical protein